MGSTPVKTCGKCGREVTRRKKWARDWDQVRYCSAKCRSQRLTRLDRELELEILRLLRRREGATICPSEAARRIAPVEWRTLMEPARQAARRLVARGAVEITQGGRRVNPSRARGPIRIRRIH